MKEEKFISIEYETWHSKYLPLEQENERLKKELDSKDILVTIYEHVNYELRGVSGAFSVNYNHTQKEIGEKIDKHIKGKYMTWYQHEEMGRRLNEKISKIPFIIRWLFKIKI